MNSWLKFKATVLQNSLNQNATYVELLRAKSKQVKVENIQNYNYFKRARYRQIPLEYRLLQARRHSSVNMGGGGGRKNIWGSTDKFFPQIREGRSKKCL